MTRLRVSGLCGRGEPRGRKSITNDATKLNTRRLRSDCELAQVSAFIDRCRHLVLHRQMLPRPAAVPRHASSFSDNIRAIR